MNQILRSGLIGLAATALLSVGACSGSSETKGDEEPQFVEDMHDFMNEEVDTLADEIWERQGWVLTAKGETKLFPTDDAGWQAVVDAADEMMAVSEELASDKYSLGEADWVTYSEGLAVAAQQVKDAALVRDEQAVFDAGGLMYQVCLSCHERFRTYGGYEAE